VTVSSELSARLILARNITADFDRQSRSLQSGTDWLEFGHRLNTALAGLIGAIDDAQFAATGTLPDTSTVIAAKDLMTVLGALNDGAGHRAMNGDYIIAARYRSLARALGDDR
jgi:kynureninase